MRGRPSRVTRLYVVSSASAAVAAVHASVTANQSITPIRLAGAEGDIRHGRQRCRARSHAHCSGTRRMRTRRPAGTGYHSGPRHDRPGTRSLSPMQRRRPSAPNRRTPMATSRTPTRVNLFDGIRPVSRAGALRDVARRRHARVDEHPAGARLHAHRGHAGRHRALHRAAAAGRVRGLRLVAPSGGRRRLGHRGDPRELALPHGARRRARSTWRWSAWWRC